MREETNDGKLPMDEVEMLCRTVRKEVEECDIACGRGTVEAIILFGSYAEGHSDCDSDLDVLCLTRHRYLGTPQLCHGQRLIDLHAISIAQLRRSITKEQWNNNYLLSALRRGRILYDRCGHGKVLHEEGMRLWVDGCGLIPSDQRLLHHEGIIRILETADKLKSRIVRFGELFCEMNAIRSQVDSLYMQVAAVYCRALGRWAYPPWIIARWETEEFYRALWIKQREFFNTGDIEQRIEILKHLAQSVLSLLGPVDNGSLF